MLIDNDFFIKLGFKFNYCYSYDDSYLYEFGTNWEDNGRSGFITWYSRTNMLRIQITDLGYNHDGPKISNKFYGRCETTETFMFIWDLVADKNKIKINTN